jgi:hypothetical protein
MNTKFFTSLVVNHYVDVGNDDFEPYYKLLFVQGTTNEEVVFSASILALNHLLKNQWNEAKFYYKKIKKNKQQTSPPLAGRIALLDWIFNDNFEALIENANKFSTQILYFSLDIIPYFILKNRVDLLKKWFYHFPIIKHQSKSWVEKDIVKIMNIAHCLTNENYLGVKKILEDDCKLMNTKTLSYKAIKSIENKIAF